MQAVILAGGLGTRIKTISGDLPKGLIPIMGIPFLFYQLNWLYRNKIESILLLTGYGAAEIKNILGLSFHSMPVSYSTEDSKLLGTAGALRLAADRNLLQSQFIVLYGDSFLPVELDEFLYSSIDSKYSTMGILENNNYWDRSNVIYEGGVVKLYDKQEPDPTKIGMKYIDYGITILKRDVILDYVRSGEVCDLAAIFKDLSIGRQLYGFEFKDRFFEIGSPEGLIDFKNYASNNPSIIPSLGKNII